MQSYKVFAENYTFQFIENKKNILIDSFIIDEKEFNKDSFLNIIEGDLHNHIYILSSNAKDAFKNFKSFFDLIKAAGGIVKNTSTNKYLFINRFGMWDLPKGKFESNDKSVIDCAKREVSEECGFEIFDLEMVKELQVTSHYYLCKYTGNHVIKDTYWFLMNTLNENVEPQIEEDIDSCIWFSKEDVKSVVCLKTYPNIRLLLEFLFFK